ncbi:MAG: hypothetical protein KDD38_06010, partial [Bdellovibrionales bacterium]|nr:hypothetical protein [Bdellovibrionales bacterium]
SGRPMHLIATDGGLLPAPLALQSLSLATGERAEILITPTGNDRLLARTVDNSPMMGHMGRRDDDGAAFTVLPIAVDESSRARIERIPDSLGAAEPSRSPPQAQSWEVTLDMGMGMGGGMRGSMGMGGMGGMM